MCSTILNTLTGILDTLKKPEWYVAIGTLLLAWATFRSLSQYRKSEQKRRDIDTLEKIIKPLCKDLKEVACYLERLSFPSSFEIRGGKYVEEGYPLWEKIKQESFYLLGNLDKKIRDKIDKFSKSIKEFIYLYNQSFEQLRDIMYEEIKSRIKKESWGGGIGEGIYYQATIGGKPIGGKNPPGVLILNLIFRDQTLEEYIEEFAMDPALPNKKLEKESFMIGGSRVNDLGRKDFMVIDYNIKQKILKEPKLQELIEISRKIHREVKNLEEDLDKEKNRLSKS